MAIDPLLVLDAQEYIEAAITEASANGVSTIPGWMWQLRAYLNSTTGSGGSSSGGSTPTGDFATQTTLAAILAELRDDVFVSSALWEDRSSSTPVFYREERIKSQDTGTVSTVYTRLSDNTSVGSLPVGATPVQGDADREIESYRWRVKAGQSGTGYSSGDFLTNTIVFNTSGSGSVDSNTWYNLTTSTAIAAPDPTKIESLDEKLLQSILTLLTAGLPLSTNAATETTVGLVKTVLDAIATRQGTNGDAASASGSQAAQLRQIAALLANPLSVSQSGDLIVKQGGTWTVSTGGLTDTQLRATPPSFIPTDGTTAISLSTSDADGTSTTSNRLRVTGHSKAYNGTTWDMVRAGVTGIVGSVTGFLNGLVFGQYKSTPPTLTDGQYTSLQLDSAGNLKVSTTGLTDAQLRASAINVIASDGTNAVSVSTGTADGVTSALNRLRVASASLGYNGATWDMLRSGVTGVVSGVTGFLNNLVFGQYKSTPPTLTDGQWASLQLDAAGNLKTASQGLKLNSSTATTVTINSSGGIILAANTARTGAVITNLSTSVCYLFFAGAAGTAGTGTPLTTYGSAYVIDATGLYQGAVYGITAAGTTSALSITEFS
jgi:hypothetical protein